MDAGIDVGLDEIQGVSTGGGPEQLECGDDSQTAEAMEVRGVHELQMSDGVRQAAVAVPLTGNADTVKGCRDGAIADGMNMYDESLQISACADIGKGGRIEQQIA